MSATPQERRDAGGCICVIEGGQPYGYDIIEGQVVWRIDPDCGYHSLAAKYPDDHSIPWNCPTFWDGCNCRRGEA